MRRDSRTATVFRDKWHVPVAAANHPRLPFDNDLQISWSSRNAAQQCRSGFGSSLYCRCLPEKLGPAIARDLVEDVLKHLGAQFQVVRKCREKRLCVCLEG